MVRKKNTEEWKPENIKNKSFYSANKWPIVLAIVLVIAIGMLFVNIPYTTSVSYQNYESYEETEYYNEQVPYECSKCNDVNYNSALMNSDMAKNCVSTDRVCEYTEQYCISTGTVCTNQQQYCCEKDWLGLTCVKWCNRCLQYNYPCNQYGTRCASWKNICLTTDVVCKAVLHNYEAYSGNWQLQFKYYDYNNELLTTKTDWYGVSAMGSTNVQNIYTVSGDGSTVRYCSPSILTIPQRNVCDTGICYRTEQKSRSVTKWHYVTRCRDETQWINIYQHAYYWIYPPQGCYI